MIISVLGLSLGTVLLKYVDSKMIRRDSNQLRNKFQSLCLLLTWDVCIRSVKAKSAKVFAWKNYC
jgi:hypothetical protein